MIISPPQLRFDEPPGSRQRHPVSIYKQQKVFGTASKNKTDQEQTREAPLYLCVKSAKTVPDMERSVRFAVVCVGVSLLISCHPVEAWYKQSTGPSYYSVGRASGLLSGIRRSPYVRRSESEETLPDSGETAGNSVIPDTNRQISLLKSMAICVKDISPNLKSCELLRDGTGTFQCKADVFLTLDSLDCLSA